MATPERKARKRRFPLFQLLLAVGLLSLVWYAFGANVLSPASQPALPERVGTLKLTGSVSGAEAIEQVSKLHGVKIKLASAYIGEYSGGSDRATVWIGESANHDAAADLLSRMVQGIEKGGTPFGGLRRLNVDNNDVWQADGKPGETYYFYQSSKRDSGIPGENYSLYRTSKPDAGWVVWLTIQSRNAPQLLELLVKTF